MSNPPDNTPKPLSSGASDKTLPLGPQTAAAVRQARSGQDTELEQALATLPNYSIEAKLGEGGMGAVYRAQQKTLNRTVAIKVLPQRLAGNPSYVSRLKREAMVLARISHPNVVTCIDLGEHQGMLYVVMEFVAGESFAGLLARRNRLPEDEALALLKQAIQGLDHAHAQGVLHRDIKPDNMLLAKVTGTTIRGPFGHNLKIADLGLATFTTEDTQNTRLTQEGMAVGSPHYMSPEQTMGEREVDLRTDIYALGITLYQALTGRLPFDAPSVAAIMAKKLTEIVPDPRSVVPDLSPGVALLIHKMTAREKADRYADYGQLMQDVEAVEQKRALSAAILSGERASVGLLPETIQALQQVGTRMAPFSVATGSAVTRKPWITVGAVLVIGAVLTWYLLNLGKTGASSVPLPTSPAEGQRAAPTVLPPSGPDATPTAAKPFFESLSQSTAGWNYSGDHAKFDVSEDDDKTLYLHSTKNWAVATKSIPADSYKLQVELQIPRSAMGCELRVGGGPQFYVAAGIRRSEAETSDSLYLQQRVTESDAVLGDPIEVPGLKAGTSLGMEIEVSHGQATIHYKQGSRIYLGTLGVDPKAGAASQIQIAVRDGIGQFRGLEIQSISSGNR